MKDSKYPPLRKTPQIAEGRPQCCVCDTNKHEELYRKINNHELIRCKNCGLVFLNKDYDALGFIADAQKDLQSHEKEKIEYWSFPEIYSKHEKIFKYFFEDRLRKIYDIYPNPRSMFDIGCGYGFWMKYCKEKGLNVYGIDPSQEAIDWAVKTYNLNAKKWSIEELVVNNSYDVIVMCDVLEHLKDPLCQLKKIKELLNPDGIIYIQVPNLIGFKLPLGHGFGLPHHIWQFSIQTITKLLEKAGYKVESYHTGVQGVIGSYERGGPSVRERITWWVAKTLRVGNRLQILARKK